MAGSFSSAPLNLQPSPLKAVLPSNYLTSADFDFLNQYLPDTYEKEFERFGNRSVSSFLRMVGAELPSNSDLIKWTEQGRLHIKYNDCVTAAVAVGSAVNTAVFTSSNTIAIRKGQTVVITANGLPTSPTPGPYNDTTPTIKGIVTDVNALTFTVAFYSAAGFINKDAANTFTVFVYGSEFKKGSEGMQGQIEAESEIFENSPIILKDKYAVSGSDMAQIGWVEVTTENGATGYLWYIKSEHETRLRFDDYLETSMIEAVPAEAGSGVVDGTINPTYGNKGSEGVFYAVENRGNVWAGGNPNGLPDFDTIIQQLDTQGAIEENVLFLNRQFGFDIDDMLAEQNSYGAGGTSYGLFDNDENMALNLGFTGFRRGYDFYKTDWKYLNDVTMRGGLTDVVGKVNGLLVPAGSTTVYDQILGKNAKRPFLHVRYRASETEDRRYKTWVTGSAGGAMNSDLDAMEVHFLSERAVCVLGANNFVLFTN